MFSYLSEKIVRLLIENQVILLEDKNIYTYGLKQFFMMILNITITIFLGIILKELWQSILFSIAYIPLRSYAGGYHAETPRRCTLFSTIMLLIVLLLMKLVIFSKESLLIMLLVSILIILNVAPVENAHKILDNMEKKIYKKNTLIILMIEIILILITLFINIKSVSVCLILALLSLSFMLVLGKIINYKGGYMNEKNYYSYDTIYEHDNINSSIS